MLTLKEENFLQQEHDRRCGFKWALLNGDEKESYRDMFLNYKKFILSYAKEQTPMTRKLLEVSTKNASNRFKEKLGVL